jgi:hypothetical protein
VSAAALALATTSLAGQAADLYRKAPPAPAPVIAPLCNWTGFYVGVNIGGAWLNTTVTDAFAATIETVVTGIDQADGGADHAHDYRHVEKRQLGPPDEGRQRDQSADKADDRRARVVPPVEHGAAGEQRAGRLSASGISAMPDWVAVSLCTTSK